MHNLYVCGQSKRNSNQHTDTTKPQQPSASRLLFRNAEDNDNGWYDVGASMKCMKGMFQE